MILDGFINCIKNYMNFFLIKFVDGGYFFVISTVHIHLNTICLQVRYATPFFKIPKIYTFPLLMSSSSLCYLYVTSASLSSFSSCGSSGSQASPSIFVNLPTAPPPQFLPVLFLLPV